MKNEQKIFYIATIFLGAVMLTFNIMYHNSQLSVIQLYKLSQISLDKKRQMKLEVQNKDWIRILFETLILVKYILDQYT